MAINLLTMKCAECGGGALQRTGHNQYTCQHCGSVSLVEDDVSDRLDRVLHQVKNAAAGLLAAEEAERERQVRRVTLGVLLSFIALGIVALSIGLYRSRQSAVDTSFAARASVPAISADGLKLEATRQVLVSGASFNAAKLLVEMRNETGAPLWHPRFKATFFDGEQQVGQNTPLEGPNLLAPGESAPVLVDLPSTQKATRQTLTPDRLSRPHDMVDGPALGLAPARLVQQGDKLRLVGRIVNARKDASLESCAVLVRVFDSRGELAGLGYGPAEANSIVPGGRSSVDVRVRRFAPLAPIAAWDYRIDYGIKTAAAPRTALVLSDNRIVRATSAPEAFDARFDLGTQELLTDEATQFDSAQLELLSLVPGRSNIQRPVYLSELVNRSKDRIALAPGAVITQFDGSKQTGEHKVSGLTTLYPGERFPLLLESQGNDRISQTRIAYKPMRAAALPGPRVPLDIKIEGTKAEIGSVLLNFSQRFSYKSVQVSGSVTNPGSTIVTKLRLWVSLRDKDGKLSGFKKVDNLPAIGPNQSVPFQVDVDQNGRDFAGVDTFYQTD